MIKSNELRRTYIDFFVSKGHKEIASASLIPDNDPSVLFTTAGMHPLVPYLMGQTHPLGCRLVNCQKCLRTGDIDEVGDANHLTFFEMMGNWSLNDYFKTESIAMSHEFLTQVLHIPQEKISVSVFGGDKDAPLDEESRKAWQSLGYPDSRIYFYGKKENWWGPVGETGPCGPDTEIFYDTGKEVCCSDCGPSCNCGKYVEIWNNVFMEYEKQPDGSYQKMAIHNVDTGLGLDRVLAIMNGVGTVYDTEQFIPVIRKIEELTGKRYQGADAETTHAFRVVCDHMRAATFILGDDKGVSPSNVDQGYVLRRFIRRVMRYLRQLGTSDTVTVDIAAVIVDQYKDVYPELQNNRDFIMEQLHKEESTFNKTLAQGLRVAVKHLSNMESGSVLDGETAFRFYDTFGFPLEFTEELAKEKGLTVDLEGFDQKYAEHQEKSRQGAAQKFKGGLADHSEQTTRLHTATHLLNGALRKVLGDGVYQKGSNITTERLRFDFSFDRKMTDEEIAEVQRIVNESIQSDVPVVCEEMSLEDARASGAIGAFGDKYGERVKVYSVEGYSKEFCGGPHVEHTGELNKFTIQKESASSAGVRRIKAVLD